MKKYVKYTLETLEPVKMGAQGSQNDCEYSLTYIAGSTIRGAYINAYIGMNAVKKDIAENACLRDKLLSDRIKFFDVYPEPDGYCFIPLPLCFYAEKRQIKKLDYKDDIEIVKSDDGNVDWNYKRLPEGDFVLLGGSRLELFTPSKIYNLHINKQEDKDNIFRYEAIAGGQKFYGIIQCEDDLEQEVLKTFEDKTVYIGGSRSSGYGKCRISGMESLSYNQLLRKLNIQRRRGENQLTVYFLSNTILRNEEGQVASRIDEKTLEERLGISKVRFTVSSVLRKMTSGFNHKWRSRLPQVTAVRAGSVMAYDYEGILDEKKIIELEESGIGERVSEGFGRILINPDLDYSRCRLYRKKNDMTDIKGIVLDDEDKRDLQRLVNIIDGNRLEKEIEKKVVSIADKFDNKYQLSKSQTARLLEVVRKARKQEDKQKAKKIVLDFRKRLTDATCRKYKLTRVFKYSMYSFLEEIFKDGKTLADFTESWINFIPVSLGDIKSRGIGEPDTILLYIEKLLHLELRKEDDENGN